MALPVFRAAGAKSEGATGTVTVSAPAGIATGDLEFLVTSTDTLGTASITSNGGGAWTAVSGTPITVSTGETLYVWWRIRAAGDSDPTVQATFDHCCAARLAYQGGTFDATTPLEIATTGTESTNDTSFSFAPGTTTAGLDRLVLVIATSITDSSSGQVPVCTNANLTSLASRANYNTLNGGGGGFGITEGARATAGAVGTFACTYATASPKAYISFAIRPSVPITTSGYATAGGVGGGSGYVPGIGGIDAYTVLMLHCNGADGSTVFADSSASAHTMTAAGNAQIDTAQSQFGGASALFDGSGDYISTPDSADWTFGSGDFTLECWVRFNALGSERGFVAQVGAAGQQSWRFEYNPFVGGLYFWWTTDGSSGQDYRPGNWTPSTGVWYHVALVRYGSILRAFVNGTQTGTDGTLSETIFDSTSPVTVGISITTGQSPMNGWLEEVRVSKGIARWTSTFTPPTSPYTPGTTVVAVSAAANASAAAPVVKTPLHVPAATANASATAPTVKPLRLVAATATAASTAPRVKVTPRSPAEAATASSVAAKLKIRIKPDAAGAIAQFMQPLLSGLRVQPPAATATASINAPAVKYLVAIPAELMVANAELPVPQPKITIRVVVSTATAAFLAPRIGRIIRPPAARANASKTAPILGIPQFIRPPAIAATAAFPVPGIYGAGLVPEHTGPLVLVPSVTAPF